FCDFLKDLGSSSRVIPIVHKPRLSTECIFRNSSERGQHIGYAYADYLVAKFLEPRGDNAVIEGYGDRQDDRLGFRLSGVLPPTGCQVSSVNFFKNFFVTFSLPNTH